MSAATDTQLPKQLGDAIVSFALEGRFPDEEVSSLPLPTADLSLAVDALAKAKTQLESEIHIVNEETKDEVSSWVAHTKTLQEDILRSKRLADDIVLEAESPVVSGKEIEDAEEHIEFLRSEVAYNRQLHEALSGIHKVNGLLNEVEKAMNERRVLDSLRSLECFWAELDAIPINKKSCRITRLLDVRAFELKSAVHDVFDHVWNALVHVDREAGRIAIYNSREDEQMTLSEAVIGLEAYKEVEDRMSRLWRDIDRAIVASRLDPKSTQLSSFQINENILERQGTAGNSIDELFKDLTTMVGFLAQRLPPDLLIYLGPIMMSGVLPRLIDGWLSSTIPVSLKDVEQFQAVIQSARVFCETLEDYGLSGFTELKEWVGNAPSTWLAKRTETALDAVRSQFIQGLGAPKQVEKVEKQMVSRSEGKELASQTVATQADDDDWGAAWGADDPMDEPDDVPQVSASSKTTQVSEVATTDDDGADAWGWGDDEPTTEAKDEAAQQQDKTELDDDDDAAAAWGWGDEEEREDQVVQPPKDDEKKARSTKTPSAGEEYREMVLKETYHISSMPDPVLELILTILDDGAALTQPSNETKPVASAAAGLFGLPTSVLAIFRALSPHYYAAGMGGNMFLYNDAMYLAERLAELTETWKSRNDLPQRAKAMLRIDDDIKTMRSFANRTYTGELGLQKTVIRDLLGGEQSIVQQQDAESSVDSAVARVRTMATTWETILARSVWCQATGSLVDALSAKIISDVMDAPSIGQDEAYKMAQLIAKATELDDLFLPSRAASSGQEQGQGQGQADPDEVPTTAQYAGTWLRLKYLSEVLQSNLNEVRYLWFESELSLYFSAEEVVDLIEASFELNARTRDTIRQIRERPQPVEGV
ncbi:hypothetical protein SODALDRAFT_327907 [Sodiomyces alkalinus F11]|uniref:ZW10 C-terminal helical domain-containing protein n=1 Tax=Sodiomyces alkalinus (strain CBS 110278 / VKM F-3762 / F11) TaxID=1314773 RepID=A0A3N2QAC5_SODAK|nr:hypothetical protein SODALDRAFT_327907 [Sodiomyces alkalinus F11]ROT43701.1 hypothetical protein SODALDRAFT_327907 [Sodiomyces alkalinus F11]